MRHGVHNVKRHQHIRSGDPSLHFRIAIAVSAVDCQARKTRGYRERSKNGPIEPQGDTRRSQTLDRQHALDLDLIHSVQR